MFLIINQKYTITGSLSPVSLHCIAMPEIGVFSYMGLNNAVGNLM